MTIKSSKDTKSNILSDDDGSKDDGSKALQRIKNIDKPMENGEGDQFWINDPSILLKEDKIKDIWIKSSMTQNEKLNAITRLVILLTLLGYFFTRSLKIIGSGVATLIVLVILFYSRKSDNDNTIEGMCGSGSASNIVNKFYESKVARDYYTYPTEKNPNMNVLLPEIQDNPRRNMAAPPNNPVIATEINTMAKEMTLKNLTGQNPREKTEVEKKLYSDLGDNFEFEQSMRQFYTTPSTTIPNNQKEFAEFCYDDLINNKSRKHDTISIGQGDL